MEEDIFLKRLAKMKKLDPKKYRVAVSDLFRDFIREQLERKTGVLFETRVVSISGLSFVHRPDLWIGPPSFPDIYIETKVIAIPERVAPDHDKRMYEIALASVDLKLKVEQEKCWREIKNARPCVAFALAIPSNTPPHVIEHVEEHAFSLRENYLNACCLYLFDLEQMKRRDDLMKHSEVALDNFLAELKKYVKAGQAKLGNY